MSNTALTYVWTHSKQASTHLLVMIALADAANNDGVCWWGKTKLAARCRVTEARLKTVIRDLERAGELQVIEGGYDKEAKKNVSNHYLIMGLAEPSAEARPIEPAKPKKRNFVKTEGGNTVDPHRGQDGLPPVGNTVDPQGGNTVDPKPSLEPTVNPHISPDGVAPAENLDDWFTPYEEAVKQYGPPKSEFEEMVDAVCEVYGIGGEQARDYAAMLRGTAKKEKNKDWGKYRIEGGITADEFRTWAEYYKTVQMPGAILAKEPNQLNGYVMGWIAKGKPNPHANGSTQHPTQLDLALKEAGLWTPN